MNKGFFVNGTASQHSTKQTMAVYIALIPTGNWVGSSAKEYSVQVATSSRTYLPDQEQSTPCPPLSEPSSHMLSPHLGVQRGGSAGRFEVIWVWISEKLHLKIVSMGKIFMMAQARAHELLPRYCSELANCQREQSQAVGTISSLWLLWAKRESITV